MAVKTFWNDTGAAGQLSVFEKRHRITTKIVRSGVIDTLPGVSAKCSQYVPEGENRFRAGAAHEFLA